MYADLYYHFIHMQRGRFDRAPLMQPLLRILLQLLQYCVHFTCVYNSVSHLPLQAPQHELILYLECSGSAVHIVYEHSAQSV
jgi:hypothetical protein